MKKILNSKTEASDFFFDKIHEECGVFGIYAAGKNVAEIIFYGLQALQHRGQESAGNVRFSVRSNSIRITYCIPLLRI